MRTICVIMILIPLIFGQIQKPDYGRAVWMLVQGTDGQRDAAAQIFVAACDEWGVNKRKMYRLIVRESNGKIYAFNGSTCARGLCQLTEIAIRHLPFADEYFSDDGRLNKGRIYSCTWNIRGGVAYMAICERMARKYHADMPREYQRILSVDDVSILLYAWGAGNFREWLSALEYIRFIGGENEEQNKRFADADIGGAVNCWGWLVGTASRGRVRRRARSVATNN